MPEESPKQSAPVQVYTADAATGEPSKHEDFISLPETDFFSLFEHGPLLFTLKEPLTLEKKAEFIYHSNTIERVDFSEEETLKILLGARFPSGNGLPPELVSSHLSALEFALSWRHPEPVTQDSIRQVHKLLFKDNYAWDKDTPPGEYRHRRINIGGRECPDPLFVFEHMDRYERYLFRLDAKKKVTSKELFRLHCEYEIIHPFKDGNGRSGRIIWAGLRRRYGLPVLVIDSFSLSKSAYYNNITESFPGFRKRYSSKEYLLRAEDLAIREIAQYPESHPDKHPTRERLDRMIDCLIFGTGYSTKKPETKNANEIETVSLD